MVSVEEYCFSLESLLFEIKSLFFLINEVNIGKILVQTQSFPLKNMVSDVKYYFSLENLFLDVKFPI